MQIPESSCSEIFNGQVRNPSVKMQHQLPEVLSSEETWAKIESLRLQHQGNIEAANQLLRKQEL